jgi:hypothetical protein
VNFTGGFSGHSYDQEQDFDGNKAGFSNGGDNSTPSHIAYPLRI